MPSSPPSWTRRRPVPPMSRGAGRCGNEPADQGRVRREAPHLRPRRIRLAVMGFWPSLVTGTVWFLGRHHKARRHAIPVGNAGGDRCSIRPARLGPRRGAFRVAVRPDFPQAQAGGFNGYDIDVVYALADRLGLRSSCRYGQSRRCSRPARSRSSMRRCPPMSWRRRPRSIPRERPVLPLARLSARSGGLERDCLGRSRRARRLRDDRLVGGRVARRSIRRPDVNALATSHRRM